MTVFFLVFILLWSVFNLLNFDILSWLNQICSWIRLGILFDFLDYLFCSWFILKVSWLCSMCLRSRLGWLSIFLLDFNFLNINNWIRSVSILSCLSLWNNNWRKYSLCFFFWSPSRSFFLCLDWCLWFLRCFLFLLLDFWGGCLFFFSFFRCRFWFFLFRSWPLFAC